MSTSYEALLLVSFGGPEGPDDVLPFLDNVLRGRNVPRQRMLEVAEHYRQFGGVSPLNEQNRQLISALSREFDEFGPRLPIYFGNRNWHPFLTDAVRQMAADGVRSALALFTSAYSSYSGCRQYRENIAAAQAEVGPNAPRIDKLRAYFNHPGFVATMTDRVAAAYGEIPAERRLTTRAFFTAHSIPRAMAETCQYEQQLQETSRLVANACGLAAWELAYQSRSGPPQQPWLEPDVGERLIAGHEQSPITDALIVPIGFVSDHLEVVYDLDTVVRQLCAERGINYVRAATAGRHPRFVRMCRELIIERMSDDPRRATVGDLPACPDICPVDCCRYEPRR